jgi:hypothetical protein
MTLWQAYLIPPTADTLIVAHQADSLLPVYVGAIWVQSDYTVCWTAYVFRVLIKFRSWIQYEVCSWFRIFAVFWMSYAFFWLNHPEESIWHEVCCLLVSCYDLCVHRALPQHLGLYVGYNRFVINRVAFVEIKWCNPEDPILLECGFRIVGTNHLATQQHHHGSLIHTSHSVILLCDNKNM